MKVKLSVFLAEYLVKKGITDTFMVTGGGAMHLDDALGHNPDMHITFNHHEQACAIAAEGYARASGKLPLVCVTSGPGGTNAITGLIGAWLDSVPMLVISGQVKRETTIVHSDVKLRQLGDQEFNIVDMVKPATKFAVYVDDPNMIKYYLDKAIYLATSGRFGPCWIDIPLDVQGAVIDTDELVEFSPDELEKEYPEYSGQDFDAFISHLKTAKRPLIYAGEGIRFSKSKDLLLKFAEKYNIPVVTCWNALDMFPGNHPLFAGLPGTVGTRGGNFNVQNCDFLMVLGCRLNIRQISYNWQCFAKNAYIAMVDIDKNEMYKKTIKIDLPIHADVHEFLEYVLHNAELDLDFSNWAKRCHDLVIKYTPVLPEYSKNNKPLNPYYFMGELFKKFSKDEIVVMGNGAAAVITQQCAVTKENTILFTNSGCASMGYGFPAAIGAAQAFNGHRVVCIDGDGSFQMNLQEMQTVIFNQWDLKIIYLNNNGYSSIKQTQTNLFKPPFIGIGNGYGLSMPDMSKVAVAYGFPYVKVDSIDTIGLIDEAFAKKGPAFIEVVADENQFFSPKLSSKVLPDGKMVSPEIDDMFPFLSKEEYDSNKIK